MCAGFARQRYAPSFFSLLLSRLELSDTKVYAPYIRARLGTAAHFCEVVVLKLSTHLLKLVLDAADDDVAPDVCVEQTRHTQDSRGQIVASS